MSQLHDENSKPMTGSASRQNERRNSSSSIFRGVQRANGFVIENTGRKMPRDVQDLVSKHLRKARDSPRLSEEDVEQVFQSIDRIWNIPGTKMSDIIAPSLFSP
jgi:hypothetical protein